MLEILKISLGIIGSFIFVIAFGIGFKGSFYHTKNKINLDKTQVVDEVKVVETKEFSVHRGYPILGEKLGYFGIRDNGDDIFSQDKSNCIEGINQNGETGLPYDVLIKTNNGKTIGVDVKTSVKTKNNYFSGSKRESISAKEFVKDSKNKYFVLFINNVGFENTLRNGCETVLSTIPKYKLFAYNEIIKLKKFNSHVYC